MSDRLTENLVKAETWLAPFKRDALRHWIDGEPRGPSTGETFENRTPVDDSSLGAVASGDAVDVDRATHAASQAFANWRKMAGGKRRALLHDIADAIEANAEQIAMVESMDSGQPVRFMATAAKRGAENFRFFADRALDAAVFMIYSLNGERCTSSSRLLVQDTIYDDFVARVSERIRQIRVGHPLDPETEVGPLIHPRHVEKVRRYLDLARHEGARVHTGGAVTGSTSSSGGNFVPPTLFSRARNDMRIAQEEIFGPVLTAIPFRDEAEALRLANDVRYGLAGYVWTGDAGRAHRFAEGLDAGMVWVNSENNRHLPSPFGGMKYSGIGRDGGDYSFDFYMETKNVCIARGTHRVPSLGR